MLDLSSTLTPSQWWVKSRVQLELSQLLACTVPAKVTCWIAFFWIEKEGSKLVPPSTHVQRVYGFGELQSRSIPRLASLTTFWLSTLRESVALMKTTITICAFSVWPCWCRATLSTTQWTKLTRMPYKACHSSSIWLSISKRHQELHLKPKAKNLIWTSICQHLCGSWGTFPSNLKTARAIK